MTNPVLQSFLIGRALAETIKEQAESAIANALSEAGKFDADQRERLRNFSAEVMARAEQQSATTASPGATAANPGDLQETIDDLRAEVALLRSKLQEYRNQ